jgi:uncharacterized protein YprB with RNaseH-like and TPR domain
MLPHTFAHIPGIGFKTEQKLWAAGIHTWDDWKMPPPLRLSSFTKIEAEKILNKSRVALAARDPRFFTDRLASSEPWRIFPHFRDQMVYLDIETSGTHEHAEITTIALYDGTRVHSYVNGENLYDFVNDINKYTVIVSYSGKSFDVPVLERYFSIRLEHAHIDLRHVLANLGIRGGLKSCEKQLGLSRGLLDGVDGSYAVALWNIYRRTGDCSALDTLRAYNIEDTVNLEQLAVEAYNRYVAKTPFAEELHIPCPVQPDIPFQPDLECLSRIRYEMLHLKKFI